METNHSFQSLLLQQSNRLFHLNQDLIDELKKIVGEETEIPNIGITFNNKLVEIFSIFSNQKVSFDQSELRVIIYSQLTKMIDESLNYLKQYILCIEKIINTRNKIPANESIFGRILFAQFHEEIDDLFLQCEEFLNFYQKIDDNLFHYDIGKDIPNYVLNHPEVLDEILDEINHSLTKEEVLHNCNIDLRELGYEEKIELDDYIDDDILLDKYFNSINLNFDIYEIVSKKIEEYKVQFQNFPFVRHAVEEYLLDDLELSIDAYKDNNWDVFLAIRDKVMDFSLEENLIEIIGKRIGFYQYINSIDLDLDYYDYQQELKELGYEELLPIIQEEAKEKKYFQYGKNQFERLNSSQEEDHFTK